MHEGAPIGAHQLSRSAISDSTQPTTAGYAKLKDVKHDARVVGSEAAHVLLPWVHRLFANLIRWALGVYQGLRRKHLQSYLDEFVFRFNRRYSPKTAFHSLLSIGAKNQPHNLQC